MNDVPFETELAAERASDEPALVARHPHPGSLTVVTSDGGLAARVRDAGAEVVGAGEFLRALDDAE